MRIPRTLSWYVLAEVLLYAGLGILAVGGVLVIQNAMRHLQDLAGMGLTFGDAARLIEILVARFSTYAVPMAFLFGVMVAIGRLSSDTEIAAMQSLGVSFAQIIAPVLAASVVVAAGTAWLLHSAEPQARRELRGLLGQVAARGGIIQPGTFNELDRSGTRLLYVDEREQAKLRGVLIFDRSNDAQPYTVVASTGEFTFEPDTLTGHLKLQNGDIHFERALQDDKYQRISFDAFDYGFAMQSLVGAGIERLQPQEMDTDQIAAVLAHFDETGAVPDYARVKRPASPTPPTTTDAMHCPSRRSCSPLVGVPLGVRRARGARSYGVLACVV